MSYYDEAKVQFEKWKDAPQAPIILAIESSCDETAVAIYKKDEKLSSIISSQIEIHKLFGGVVPEIAARNHLEAATNVARLALDEAKLTLNDVDVIAVTYGAGLIGALLVGVNFAKGLAFATKKPLVAVNHIQAHISANYILHPDLKPPYICLVASGGHTALVKVNDYTDYTVLGCTSDDAVGEAYDKVARLLGLPYPGGPSIEKAAKDGVNVIPFPSCKMKNKLDFSYSGLKTAVINYVHKLEQSKKTVNVSDVALSFQMQANSILIEKALLACELYKIDKLALAGGVGANKALREQLQTLADKSGITTFFPSGILCTDNADMVAMAAYYLLKAGKSLAKPNLDANADLEITDQYE